MATRLSPLIPTGTWTVDPVHSSVEFSVKHMGIANVRGRYGDHLRVHRRGGRRRLGSGNMLVGDKVAIALDISAVLQS